MLVQPTRDSLVQPQCWWLGFYCVTCYL